MDAVHIYRKYLSPHAARKQAVPIPDAVRISAVDNICKEDGQVDSDCFAQAQEYVYNIMEKE
jgi:A-kinase anchor protein 10